MLVFKYIYGVIIKNGKSSQNRLKYYKNAMKSTCLKISVFYKSA
jgi:hypothetical protein